MAKDRGQVWTIGNKLLVSRMITSTLFRLLRLVFTVIQRIYWELNGTARKLRESRDPANYERCVQVVDIVLFHKFCELQETSIDDYVYTHNRFEDPQYIIDNDDISLVTINDNSAIFGEPLERGAHLWKAKYSSFIRWSHMLYLRRLLIVPMAAFHRMSETIGDPKAEIIFLFNTARCGSTLLTQMMEYSGRCVAISEPDSLNIVATRWRKSGASAEVRQLTRDAIRWECRPYTSMQPPPLAYAIKPTGPSAVAVEMFRELFPNSRCLFMYRDFIKVAKSFYRVSLRLPTVRLVFLLGRLSGRFTEAAFDVMGFGGKDFNIRLENDLTIGVMLSVVTMKTYLQMRQKGADVAAVRYEDIVARPLDTCRAIFEYCGLPTSLAESGIKGLEVDSQKNSPLSMTIIGHFKEPEMTSKAKNQLNKLLEKNGLPLIGEECLLEGTIGYVKH